MTTERQTHINMPTQTHKHTKRGETKLTPAKFTLRCSRINVCVVVVRDAVSVVNYTVLSV